MNLNAIKERILKSILGPLWDLVKPTLKVIASESGRIAINLARSFVAAAFADPDLRGRSGKARAEWVQAKVRETAAQSGHPLADKIINAAIEFAYNEYMEKYKK